MSSGKKNKDSADKSAIALEEQKNARLLGIAASTANLISVVAKEGSKEAFLIQKAVAAAEILVADGKARALVPAQTSTIPFPANLAAIATMNAYIGAQTAIGLATVAAQTLKGFNSGGLVTDGNIFGDSTVAALTKGEIVAPRESFDEVVEGTARARGFVKPGEAGAAEPGSPNVSIVINGDILAEDSYISRLAERLADNARFFNGPLATRG